MRDCKRLQTPKTFKSTEVFAELLAVYWLFLELLIFGKLLKLFTMNGGETGI
jgi:hypothetical protein